MNISVIIMYVVYGIFVFTTIISDYVGGYSKK